MATLTGSTIASSYDQLLALPSGGGNGGTLVALTDGNAGNTFALQLSTGGIKSTGTLNVAGITTATGGVVGDLTGDVTGDLTGNVTATSVLADGVTATTQAVDNDSTKVATTAFVVAQVETSDTLAEVLANGGSATSSALAGVMSDETGSGSLVFATSPTLVTPALGTPASGALTNCTFPTLNQDTTGTAATVTGAAQSAITSVGTLTGLSMSGDLDLADDAKIQLGDGDDLQLYHDGSNTYIKDNGTGDFFIQSNGTAVKIQGLTGEDSIVATANGSVKLYYDNAGKLETASGGVNVTGDLAVSGTVTSGVWNGTAIGVAKGGTNLTSYAAGDVLYATGSTTLAKLAKPGTPAGEVLTFATSASAPSWVAPTTGDITGVTAGAGLTGGGASGDVTVTVGAGTGITVNADDVALTNTDITIGSTAISLGATATTIAGLSSVTSTTFVGALTGNCSGTAATVTGATQASITTCANLVTVGTIGTGVWQGTAVDGTYIDLEGTEVKSTGETGGTKFLREDGDNSCSWQAVSASVSIGTSIGSGTSGSVLFVDSSTQLAQDNSKLFWDDSNNRLGIGTTVPSETLAVSGGNAKITKADNVYLSLDSTQTNGDEWQIFNANSGATSTLQFKNVDQSKVVMLLDENGFVGINVTDPDSELEINGQIKITGGVPGADKVLTSDADGLATWVTPASGGKVLQVLNNTGTVADASATSATAAVSQAITPAADSNTVLVTATANFSLDYDDSNFEVGDMRWQLFRGSTALGNEQKYVNNNSTLNWSVNSLYFCCSFTFKDSPATASAATYSLKYYQAQTSGPVAVVHDAQITVQEID